MLHPKMHELVKNRGHEIADRYIPGDTALVILATRNTTKKLSEKQANMLEAIKTVYCFEGDNLILENLNSYIGGSLAVVDGTLINLIDKFIKKNNTFYGPTDKVTSTSAGMYRPTKGSLSNMEASDIQDQFSKLNIRGLI